MAGYIRNDTTNNISNGNIINASDLDGEFDAIQAAFVNTTGHTHDGTAAEGAPITKIGPTQDIVAGIAALTPKTTNTIDLGSSSLRYKDVYATGTAYVGTLDLTNALAVADGGTGSTSLAANNVLLGNGTSALQVVAPGTVNNVLYSNGTTWVAGPIPSTGAVTSFSAGTTGFTPSTATTGNITLSGTLSVANGGTGQTTYTDGQLLIGNSTGNTLTKATLTAGTGITITNGSGSITITNTASGTPTLNVVTGTTQAAVAGNHYVLTNVAATTVTLPATPAAGDVVWVTVGNGLTTNVIARNGSNIMSLAEDLTLNAAYAAVQMRYINSTIGWTFV